MFKKPDSGSLYIPMDEIKKYSSLVLEQVVAVLFVLMRHVLQDFENAIRLLYLRVQLIRPHLDLLHGQEVDTFAQGSDLDRISSTERTF